MGQGQKSVLDAHLVVFRHSGGSTLKTGMTLIWNLQRWLRNMPFTNASQSSIMQKRHNLNGHDPETLLSPLNQSSFKVE